MARTLSSRIAAGLLGAGFLAACGDAPTPPDTIPTQQVATVEEAVTLLPGDSIDLTLKGGAPASVAWSVVEGASVAAVSASGRVRAVAPGIARVRVAAGGMADSVTVSVPRLGVLDNAVRHFCAITVQGAVRCYGTEQHGELGDGPQGTATPNVVAGGHTFKAIATGRDHSCGVRTDGVAMCWGYNSYGQLGTGVQSTGAAGTPEPVAVSTTTRFAAIAAGEAHTCAIATDGAVHCWGLNSLGQLGSEANTRCTTPGAFTLACALTPTRVTGAASYRAISAGENFTCAVDDERRASCWGAGDWFARGDGTDAPTNVPTLVQGAGRYALVSAGGFHACGVTPTAATHCWGLGNSGQNALGATSQLPQAVASMPPLAMVDGAENHSCGLAVSGAALCWGANYSGALGGGSTTAPGGPTPVVVVGGHAFATVAAGGFRSCGITRAGTLYCWGEIFMGQQQATPLSVAPGVEFQR